ncbi:vesicle-associated membrane protein 7-like [Xenia sp. Carnegie-2017]|uniref:vesicle-associated membrane protein 7-like n=1 Tax=Xenia sp. Carnegie-2017 TaxID=2897299 RepID=UPI001F046C02|nr:vesicle-associated membrane protein 7-like [Xenia sp. Carnegie-2017]XP_046854258.1 vesicle-associated membrane protein 7-like [Xenia sp. Carnegie-2017]XP_046854259.1 vesicle-associated membrane protein 7-like [Xenia sp. Carnegie-2017]XP_046854260.1 vesicle-associated membrane protein 7-like [Xenia sp. Carnegie-2017]XP_046854261.1 vesicle-associated membrane protein 7-like [Xenia sp. Carnegie-2017]
MPLLYSLVSRGTTILAKYASCAGNFDEVSKQILGRIPPENAKLTYTQSSYLFHYICEDRIIYLCITDDNFERSKAFLFLTEIKKRFQRTYQTRIDTALPYAMNSEFSRVLSSEMKRYSDSDQSNDNISRVQVELDELKDIMVKNIDTISQRGERLELLIDRSRDLNNSSMTFKKSSKTLARVMWWKNVKMLIIIAVVVILILYFLISAGCGGLDWKKCT